ncbi:MAG: two pore domain potassium channel family protein, partial [Bacteroidetes bacterium]|nr:two pore domain potassium channel family protein [Bacteroidota bacterium]
SKAKINKLSFITCHLNAYFNLEFQECNLLDLSNSVVRDIVDIQSFDIPIDIKSLNLSGLLLLGNIYINWETSKVKDLILNQQTSNRNKSEQFRILKENYHTLGQYNAEDEAYVEFKRAETKADLEDAIKSGSRSRKIKEYVEFGFKWLVFDKIGLYATNPARVLVSMVFTYLFFVLIYTVLPFFVDTAILPSNEYDVELTTLGKAFYHSIVTFLTIGYGDYYPSGIFRWISGFEGFTGLFMISYFTVAFVRKVLR